MSDLIQELEKAELRDDSPDFAPGDTVRVLYNVREGTKERIQAFEGVCIGRRGGGMGETFTVRKISSGIGVERVFPLHAPTVTGVEVVRRGRVRRAKLYYMRGLRGKAGWRNGCDVHGAEDLQRDRRRASVSASCADRHESGGGPSRAGAPRQAVLYERPARQGGPY